VQVLLPDWERSLARVDDHPDRSARIYLSRSGTTLHAVLTIVQTRHQISAAEGARPIARRLVHRAAIRGAAYKPSGLQVRDLPGRLGEADLSACP
jgi:hypothetical protein